MAPGRRPLAHTLLAATGFTNRSLRALTAGLLGSDYDPGREPTTCADSGSSA